MRAPLTDIPVGMGHLFLVLLCCALAAWLMSGTVCGAANGIQLCSQKAQSLGNCSVLAGAQCHLSSLIPRKMHMTQPEVQATKRTSLTGAAATTPSSPSLKYNIYLSFDQLSGETP
jgi:hypothetical protein